MADINRVRNAYGSYDRIFHKIEELEAIATSTTKALSPMPRGGSGSPSDDAWAKLIDYKAECAEKLAAYLEMSRELESELEAIRHPGIRLAMQYRYIDCKSVAEIAELIFVDIRTVYNYLAKGKKIYKDLYK